MAKIDTVRPDAGTPRAMSDADSPPGQPGAVPPAGAALAAFRAGRSEAQRTADLLAFAIATERGLASTPDTVEQVRREADAALGDYALRHVHNSVEQIRREAVAEHLGRLRPPPRFPQLVAANLVALAIVGGLAAWLSTRPDMMTALSGLLRV